MRKRLFTAKDVSSFSVFPKKVIGVGGTSKIFLAALKFKTQKRKHRKIVAAKEFWAWPSGAEDFNRMVTRLRKFGVRIPKTGVIEHKGELYLIMEAFKAKGKTKFLGNVEAYRRFSSLTMKDFRLIKAIARDHARIFNAGYVSDTDLENYLRVEEGKRETYYFIDLHGVRKLDKKNLAIDLFRFFQDIAAMPYTKIKDPQARSLFLKTFGKSLSLRLKPYWKRVISSGTTRLNEFLAMQKR